MASAERSRGLLRKWLYGFWGALLSLYITAPVYAATFAPSQVPLLSSSAVAPNVILQVDNSGSMDTIIYDSGFDPTKTWPDVYRANYSCVVFVFCGYRQGTKMSPASNQSDYIFFKNIDTKGDSGCSSTRYGFWNSATNSVVCINLSDPAGSGNTRYPTDYLAYLIAQAGTGNIIAAATSTRMKTAISVANTLVENRREYLRMGLAAFNPPITGGDQGPGGKIQQAVDDITAKNGNTNFNNLKAAISALTSNSNTPLAETYYQVTRYFRGLTPSPSYSGAPKTFTSPIQYRCQKNYGVVITDGLPTYDRTFPTDDPRDPDDPAKGLAHLPNWDNKSSDDGNRPDSGDAEGDSLYLDDIAKFAYDIDMRKPASTPSTDLAGKSWDDPSFLKQNLRTYTVGFTAANDMLSQAATYGLGKYYQATDGDTLAAALSAALTDISSKSGSGGGGASSSSTLSSGTYYYQTLYDPADWRGVIQAFPFNSDGSVASKATWTTNDTMLPASTGVTFQSYNTANSATTAVVPLLYANFSTAQKAVLDANLPTGIKGTDLVEWTKGTNKTGLRTRTVALGDVINSPLVYASPTDQTAADLTTDASYTTYLAKKAAGMTASLLVNANDGFTNVINASTGKRVYAYMPSTALAGLNIVADTGYINGTSHKYLNDGQLTVADAQFGTVWKTLALGGTGAGGKAFYAMQLWDEATGNVPKALWEIRAPDAPNTANAFNDLGYAYAKPEVARLPDGRWAAFIANGYGSNSGVAALYVINIADGSLITKLVVSSSDTNNGLSSVKLRVNASNTVQAAYAGDLNGKLWKFDLSNTSISGWGLAFTGKPLFTTPDPTNQPITAQPLLVDNPTNGKMVYFGTGKFNETSDKTTTATQGFYAVWDAEGGAGDYKIANLQLQSINGTFTGADGVYMTSTENTVNYTSQKGWYLPLSYGSTMVGERVIYQAVYTLGRVLFTTAGVDSTDPCSSQGFGRLIELDALSGSELSYQVLDTSGDGLIDTSDTRVSGVFFASGIPTLTAVVNISATSSAPASQRKVFNLSNGDIDTLREKGATGGGKGRIMWRQIQ
jgi:type IV pilus assembly protein PilY1